MNVVQRYVSFALSVLALGLAWAGPRWSGEAEDVERSRRVWERLSEEERGTLRARYEQLQSLDPQQRKRLEVRMEMLRILKRKVLANMSADRRREFEALDPLEQDRLLASVVRSEMRRRGGRIRDKLPSEWRRRLMEAEPGERERMVEEFVQHMRGSSSERMLREMATRLGLSEDDVQRLRQLPWEQRRLEMLELRRGEIERRVAREGHPPPGVTAEQWERWQGLSTPAFFEVWFHAGPARMGKPAFPGDRPRLSPATARALLDELDVDWRERRVDWLHLSLEERRERMSQQTRERILIILELSGELSEAQLETLRALEPRQLRQSTRRVAEASLSESAPTGR